MATAFLAVLLVACDAGYEATVRNDLDEDVTLKLAFDSGQLGRLLSASDPDTSLVTDSRL